MRIQAQLNKQFFYPDEQVVVEFLLDNSRSERDIKEIRCSLKYTITVRKADKTMQTVSFDMHLLEFKGVQRKRKQERQEFVFDLAKIIGEYHKVKEIRKGNRGIKVVDEKDHVKRLIG